MPLPVSLTRPLDSPHHSLLYLFVAYKSLLLLIALCSPGPGYDTSSTLLTPPTTNGSSLTALLELLTEKLTSWDAVYFTTTARRGYLYEQEWAFAWGWTRLISFFSSGNPHSISISIHKINIPQISARQPLLTSPLKASSAQPSPTLPTASRSSRSITLPAPSSPARLGRS